jgi:hypothetical protein
MYFQEKIEKKILAIGLFGSIFFISLGEFNRALSEIQKMLSLGALNLQVARTPKFSGSMSANISLKD